MSITKTIAILGAGSGVGAAVARRFVREGYAAALMARTIEPLRAIDDQIKAEGGRALAVAADATDPASVASAFAEVRAKLGNPGVFIYNVAAFLPGGVLDVTVEQFEASWRALCFGAFLGSREVLPAMIAAGQGTVVFTGATASLRGSAGFSCLAVGKFGLRALAQSMARELGPKGVHVAHVVVDGGIDTPRLRAMRPARDAKAMLSPEAIAETYWHLHAQDATAWTHEIDVRPAVEKF